MAQIFSVSIDLNKIDRTKVKPHTNGAAYYQMSVIVKDEKDQYGNDVAVAEGQSKEERTAGGKQKYIGSGKLVWEGQQSNQNTPTTSAQNNTPSNPAVDDGLPDWLK